MRINDSAFASLIDAIYVRQERNGYYTLDTSNSFIWRRAIVDPGPVSLLTYGPEQFLTLLNPHPRSAQAMVPIIEGLLERTWAA